MQQPAVLAQATDDKSLVDTAVDFLTDSVFVTSVGVILGAVVLAVLIARLGHRAVMRVYDRRTAGIEEHLYEEGKQRVETLWRVMRRILLIVVVVIAGLTLLAVWSVPIAPFLAVGSIVGFALGFGAQSFVKDLISGFFIISENQFSIGDVVRISDVSGTVDDIRLRVTVLRDAEGIVHYVPNGAITVASNLTQEFVSVVADVGVAYGEEVDRVIEVLSDEISGFASDAEWEDRFLEPPKVLGVQDLANWSVNVRVTLKVHADARWPVRRELLRRVKNRLDAEGIEIPFPYTTLVPGDPGAWREILHGEAEPAPGP